MSLLRFKRFFFRKQAMFLRFFHTVDKFEVHENLTVSDVLTTNGWHINDDSVLFLSFRKKEEEQEEKREES